MVQTLCMRMLGWLIEAYGEKPLLSVRYRT